MKSVMILYKRIQKSFFLFEKLYDVDVVCTRPNCSRANLKIAIEQWIVFIKVHTYIYVHVCLYVMCMYDKNIYVKKYKNRLIIIIMARAI